MDAGVLDDAKRYGPQVVMTLASAVGRGSCGTPASYGLTDQLAWYAESRKRW